MAFKKLVPTDKAVIRGATKRDYRAILRMNEESVHFLSPMNESRLVHLHEQSEFLWVAEYNRKVVAFLLAIGNGKNYDSVNYTWFNERLERFLYIDRVVVSSSHQGMGIGQQMYNTIVTYGRSLGYPCLTAEIDIEPPNPGSLLFHERYGFTEIGRQSINDGKNVVSLQRLLINPRG